MMDSGLSIKNASGKTFSLLNDTPFKVCKLTPLQPKRKYHCNEPGCNKSFTTSGHLARHHRIHTGEKNFHCLHPGCPSRFSRQDNMMQHYRTHLSQKSRRQHHQKKTFKELPQLYQHDPMSLVNRPKRSTTMPSMPYYEPFIINRPRRTLSTSSSCSDSSLSTSSFTYSPPTHDYDFYPTQLHTLPPLRNQQSNNEKSCSNLLQLANIVSTFG